LVFIVSGIMLGMQHVVKIHNGSASVKADASLKDIDLKKGITWVHTVANTELELEGIRKLFGFHKLSIEDCVDKRQQPKVEVHDKYVLVILKDPDLQSKVIIDQIAFFVSKNYLVTVANRELPEVTHVIDKFKKGEVGRSASPDFIAYQILDNIVDSYFPIMDGLEDEIEVIEKDILNEPTKKDIPIKISKLKRKFLSVRKITWPAREVFSTLAKSDVPYFLPENRVYYRDVHDHMILIIDMLETYRDEVSSILESYLSALSNNLNSVMKVLTVIATIFMPITFIASLYGMNFQNGGALNMPETYWEWGYPFVLTLILTISLSMVLYFRRKGWL